MRVIHRRPVVAALLGSFATLAIVASMALAANTIRSIDVVNGSIGSADLRNSDVRSIDIRNANVLAADIRAGAVTNGKLADGSVTSAKLADGGVGSVDIADGSIVSADIADGGIGSADIADGGIASVDIADGAVGPADIADGAVASADLTDGSITSAKLAPLEAWHVVGAASEPAFENSWAAYPTYEVRFRKDRDGYVHIDGLANRAPVGYQTTMFTLPAGYRPPLWHAFAVASTDPLMSAEVAGRIYVRPEGYVIVSADTNDHVVFLDGISFPTS